MLTVCLTNKLKIYPWENTKKFWIKYNSKPFPTLAEQEWKEGKPPRTKNEEKLKLQWWACEVMLWQLWVGKWRSAVLVLDSGSLDFIDHEEIGVKTLEL